MKKILFILGLWLCIDGAGSIMIASNNEPFHDLLTVGRIIRCLIGIFVIAISNINLKYNHNNINE